jgi:hypothetical protein
MKMISKNNQLPVKDINFAYICPPFWSRAEKVSKNASDSERLIVFKRFSSTHNNLKLGNGETSSSDNLL